MSNNRPEFVHTVEAALDKYGSSLRSIIGLPLNRGWVAWDNSHDEWFSDEVVILQFGDCNLEACFYKLSDFAITWNTVDVSLQPNWMGCWEGLNLEWRQNAHPAFANVLGKELRDVVLVSYNYKTTVVQDPKHPEQVGQKQTWRLLNAIEFHFHDASLTLFNALDENGLENDLQKDDEFIKWSVLKVS